MLDGSGSVRHNSTRLPAAALKGAVSPQTTATVTPSAVDTVRTQFLSEHDTNRAGCYSSCFLSPTQQLFLKRRSPGRSGVGVFSPGGVWFGNLEIGGGVRGRVGLTGWEQLQEWSRNSGSEAWVWFLAAGCAPRGDLCGLLVFISLLQSTLEVGWEQAQEPGGRNSPSGWHIQDLSVPDTAHTHPTPLTSTSQCTPVLLQNHKQTHVFQTKQSSHSSQHSLWDHQPAQDQGDRWVCPKISPPR